MTAKIGVFADICGVRRTRSRRKLLFSRSYSPEEDGVRDLPAQDVDVLLADAQLAALAQALEGNRRPRRPGDHDVLAQPVLVLADALLQRLPERDEQGHGHGPPRDAEEGQQRPHFLMADVLQHLPQERERGHDGSQISGEDRG
jgi:hypothetical protein